MFNFHLGEDAALVYAAALDSVTVVNMDRPEGVSEAEWFDTVKRNKEHLKVVLRKPLWDGSAFDLAPLQDAAYRPDGTPPAPLAPPVPVVTARQARLAINTVPGLRERVEAAIAASDQNTQDFWEYSTEIHRDNSILLGLATALELSDAEVDGLFALAKTL